MGLRNKAKKCWELYCPICDNSITKISIAIDTECDRCGWEWKGIDNTKDLDSKIALISFE
ncbi:MAG: hypothetical protein ACFFDY_00545 [Candidatus Thorarchaeota archaeon]